MNLAGIFAVWKLPERSRIGVDQITAIAGGTPAVLIGSFFNATLIIACFWGGISSGVLLVWYALSLAIFGYTGFAWWQRRSSKHRSAGRRKIRRAVLISGLLGLPWGLLSLLALGSAPHLNELVLVAAGAGMAASGSIYLAPVYPAAIAYAGAVLLPTVFKCLLVGDLGYLYLGGFTTSYGAFLWAVIATNARGSIERSEANVLSNERSATLQAIIDNFPGGIGFLDKDLRLAVCNERAKEMLELPADLFRDGPPLIDDLIRFNGSRGEFGPDFKDAVASKIALMHSRDAFHFERERPNGTVLDVRGIPLEDGGLITTYMDITERTRSERQIAFLARHDSLTGLPNRHVFREHLEKKLAHRRKLDGESALLVLDLDRFKDVNDTLGHPTGDKLLVAVAERLRTCVRDSDLLTRLGGDEFAVIVSAGEAAANAAAVARRIHEAISAPFDLSDHHVTAGVSIGISIAPFDGETPDVLIKSADIALYRAKSEKGKGECFRFFMPEMDHDIRRRRALEQGLRLALQQGELELHYQPIYSLELERVLTFEALLRWRTSSGETVSPSEFIPLAEETGLIIPIGEWVLQEACKQARLWPGGTRVAVNLSLLQFRSPMLIDTIVDALQVSGLEPRRLELEITESAMMTDVDGAEVLLGKLKAIGVRISIDDFGIGYSSFSNLRRMKFDKLKIDQSFVRDLDCENETALALIRSMVYLASMLDMSITAEGVETADQLRILQAEGCTEIQGHYIGRPAPANVQLQLLPASMVKPAA